MDGHAMVPRASRTTLSIRRTPRDFVKTNHSAGLWRSGSVALLALLAFAPVVPGGGLVFDDHVLIERNADLRRSDVWGASFQRDYYATSERPGVSGYYRPIAVLGNAIDVRLWGRRIPGYHVT